MFLKASEFPTKRIHLYFCDVFVLQKSLGKEATAHRDWHYALLACSPQETGTFQVRMQAVEGGGSSLPLVKGGSPVYFARNLFLRNHFGIIFIFLPHFFKRFLKDACVKSVKVLISILTFLASLSGICFLFPFQLNFWNTQQPSSGNFPSSNH